MAAEFGQLAVKWCLDHPAAEAGLYYSYADVDPDSDYHERTGNKDDTRMDPYA
ncbi:hypothetical protein V2A60_002882 [Cordyceps javanica]